MSIKKKIFNNKLFYELPVMQNKKFNTYQDNQF